MPECSGAPIESSPASATSRLITVSCANEPPAPPYSSGIDAQSRPACPSLSQAERSMMPSCVHFSTCGTNSLARKRRACSSSRTRSSVIQDGRGTCRDSMLRRATLLCVALIVDLFAGLVLEPFIAGMAGQCVNAVEPRNLALKAILLGRRHRFGIVERIDRYTDAAGAVERIGERRAAVLAEAAFGEIRTLEHGWRPARPLQVLLSAAGQPHERLARGFLAHAAMAHARIGGLLDPLVAHCAALAAAGQACHWLERLRGQFHHGVRAGGDAFEMGG